jgi:glycosyltransferase involved in cell wall biosynthesis
MPAAPVRRLLMLAPASVIHTQRWAAALAGRGVEVVLATQHPDAAWAPPAGVRVVALPHGGMAGYFRNVPALRRLLRAERPELLNAHYASGYGTTAALAGWHPWLLSVWGSDVYGFPTTGAHRAWWLRRNLRSADAIASTSQAMAGQVRRLTPERRTIAITPFGIDTARFAPAAEAAPTAGGAALVIGTVKTLAPVYGVDLLLRAFAQLAAPAHGPAPTLLIVGGGPQAAELQALAAALGVAGRVRFMGPVPHAEVPAWLMRMDVYVAASRHESFGVAVLEASACARPVVVSDAGGLPEVVADGETGLVVPVGDVPALAQALARLLGDAELRRRLGEAGRRHVQRHYGWSDCVDHMLACLQAVRDRRPPPAPLS